VPGERPARWGYHRLAEPSARRLVEAAGIRRGDLVLDIGAGDGVLTQLALEHGARVVAIEAHPGRARDLRSRFAGRGVKVVRADAADLRLPTRPFVVVANPPFGITTALLKRLLARNGRLRTGVLVVPRHVAARWVGGRAPGANRWSATYDLRTVARVPRHGFVPPPPNDAVVLRISRR
jgi:23S rRNA (adenine-N6)-dimethyltransferase